jgi:hypothetical protein
MAMARRTGFRSTSSFRFEFEGRLGTDDAFVKGVRTAFSPSVRPVLGVLSSVIDG